MKRESNIVLMVVRGAGVLAGVFLALFVYLCRSALRLAIGLR